MKYWKRVMRPVITGVLVAAVLASCSKQQEKTSARAGEPVMKTVGPAGDDPTSYTEVQLSDAQKNEARAKQLKIAILMHESSDFSNSVIVGVQDTAKDLNANIVLVADAEFDANKQKTNIENALILNPDIIVALILDEVSGAAALRPAIDKGVKLSLLSNLPSSFVHGKDYASVVTDDLFGMGKSVAELINDALSGKGQVGYIFHDANYYVTNQRDAAVKNVIQQQFPGLEIVAERGIANPSDGEVIASALLTQFPNLQAIYAPWNTIAEGVISAVRSAGRKDVKVFTMDLGETVALDLAKDGNIAGIVADLPYELGVTLANAGVLSALGYDTPPFITVPAIKVTKNNLAEAWEQSLHRPLPATIAGELDK